MVSSKVVSLTFKWAESNERVSDVSRGRLGNDSANALISLPFSDGDVISNEIVDKLTKWLREYTTVGGGVVADEKSIISLSLYVVPNGS